MVLNMLSSVASVGWVPYLSSWVAMVIVGIVKLVFWLVFFLLVAIWWNQGYLLYMPSIEGRYGERRHVKHNGLGCTLPSEHGLPFEEYFIQTRDGAVLHSWFIPWSDRRNAPTILFFHGNAGSTFTSVAHSSVACAFATALDSPPLIPPSSPPRADIGNRLMNARQMFSYLHANVLLVEYRGFGNSSGAPSEPGLQIDALASLDFLLAHPGAFSLRSLLSTSVHAAFHALFILIPCSAAL